MVTFGSEWLNGPYVKADPIYHDSMSGKWILLGEFCVAGGPPYAFEGWSYVRVPPKKIHKLYDLIKFVRDMADHSEGYWRFYNKPITFTFQREEDAVAFSAYLCD